MTALMGCRPTACPSWCADDHADPEALFHESPPLQFWVRHGETRTPEAAHVALKSWNDADAAVDEPPAVVVDIPTDCWGESWLTPAQARLLAEHLLSAARRLERATGAVRSCPRSTPHEPHTWASMVPGEDWSCPGV
jgi:hypothetical protein